MLKEATSIIFQFNFCIYSKKSINDEFRFLSICNCKVITLFLY